MCAEAPLVSIIIPVYRRTTWIGRCLAALAVQTPAAPFEVVIVDDGSPNRADMSAVLDDACNQVTVPVIRIHQENAGPAAARNLGVSRARGEILCFLDDDSMPAADWLAEMVGIFAFQPNTGFVSGRTCSYDRENPLPLLLERTVYAGKTFATCNIAYRRKLFVNLQGFDESFPEPSWEDNDLGLRAVWSGAFHVYNERAVVYHPHEQTLEEYREKCRLNGRGAAAFSRKYLWRKPLWGVGTPFIMARRLMYGMHPSLWVAPELNEHYVQFLWSYYSLQGFLNVLTGQRQRAKD